MSGEAKASHGEEWRRHSCDLYRKGMVTTCLGEVLRGKGKAKLRTAKRREETARHRSVRESLGEVMA
jgi:hypothetical protein